MSAWMTAKMMMKTIALPKLSLSFSFSLFLLIFLLYLVFKIACHFEQARIFRLLKNTPYFKQARILIYMPNKPYLLGFLAGFGFMNILLKYSVLHMFNFGCVFDCS